MTIPSILPARTPVGFRPVGCCPPDMTIANINGGVVPPSMGLSRFVQFNLTVAAPLAEIVLFGTNFDLQTVIRLVGPPTTVPPLPPLTPNTLPPPTVVELGRVLPDLPNNAAGLLAFTLEATQFPPVGDDPEGWGVQIVNSCGCSQTFAVVEVGEPSASCPELTSLSPGPYVSGAPSALMVLTGVALDGSYTLDVTSTVGGPIPFSPAGPPPAPTSYDIVLDLTLAPAGPATVTLTPTDPTCPPSSIPFTIVSS